MGTLRALIANELTAIEALKLPFARIRRVPEIASRLRFANCGFSLPAFRANAGLQIG